MRHPPKPGAQSREQMLFILTPDSWVLTPIRFPLGAHRAMLKVVLAICLGRAEEDQDGEGGN
jgi:hypothetical protein